MIINVLVAFLLVAILAYRLIWPGMKMESGDATDTSTPGTTATGIGTSPPVPPQPKTGWRKLAGDNWWKVLLLIIGLAAMWRLWGTLGTISVSPPSLSTGKLWGWTQDNGLSILLVLFVLGLVSYSASWRTKLVVGIVAIAAWLFIGNPLVHHFWGEKSSSPPVAQQAAPRSMQALPQDAEVPWAWETPSAQWPRIHVPPHGDSVRVPALFGGHIVWGGQGFTVHCIYEDGHEGMSGDANRPCHSGTMVAAWARNDGDTPLYASYAYARKGEP